jgi:hypothetical protein
MPDFNLGVSTLQFAELHFLFSLLFKSGIPEDLLKTMLSQLKKPYYYSFDCIYWDFANARWRYFIQQNQIEQLPNEEARFDDYPERNKMREFDSNNSYYEEDEIYRVELAPTDAPAFQLIKDDLEDCEIAPVTINLFAGDLIVFKRH